MKKIIFSVIACLLMVNTWAQEVDTESLSAHTDLSKQKKFTVSSFGFGIGPYEDIFKGMTAEMLLKRVKDPNFVHQEDLSKYELSPYNVLMTGGNLGIFLELTPNRLAGSSKIVSQKLRLGLSMNVGRELMIDYYDYNSDEPYYYGDWLGYCLIENELQLSLDYLFSLDKKRFSVYGGPGFNAGSTFSNLLIILSTQNGSWSDDNEWRTGGSGYLRTYGIIGAGFNISKKLQFFGEFRPGIGLYFTQQERVLSYSNIAGQFGLRFKKMK